MKTKNNYGLSTGSMMPHPTDISVPGDVLNFMADYIDSTGSLLDELEKTALLYESGKNIQENTGVINRVLHKLKGEASIMGFDEITAVCHQAESAFVELPQAQRAEMLLRFKDWLRSVIEYFSTKI